MNSHSFKVKKSSIGLLVFLMIFPLDTIFNLIGKVIGVDLPVGMVGIIIAFSILPLVAQEKGLSFLLQMTHFILFFFLFVLMLLSHRSTAADCYFWLRAFALFYSGSLFYYWFANKDSSYNFRFLNPILFVLVFAVIFINYGDINYLRLSTGTLMFALMVMATKKTIIQSLFIFIIFVPLLYILESRFSLFSLFICFIALWLSQLSKLKTLLFILLTFSLFYVAYGVGSHYFGELASVHDNRLLRIIYATDQDTSLSARVELFSKSVEVIVSNPFFGEYKYYRDYGSDGAYAHSIFSFWAEFGVFGLIYSFFLLASCILSLLKSRIFSKNSGSVSKFVFMISLFVIVGMLFFKSYVWSVMYFVCGFNLVYLTKYMGAVLVNEHHISPPTASRF